MIPTIVEKLKLIEAKIKFDFEYLKVRLLAMRLLAVRSSRRQILRHYASEITLHSVARHVRTLNGHVRLFRVSTRIKQMARPSLCVMECDIRDACQRDNKKNHVIYSITFRAMPIKNFRTKQNSCDFSSASKICLNMKRSSKHIFKIKKLYFY